MKVKLTGEITLYTEFEVEIDDLDFEAWCKYDGQVAVNSSWIPRYLDESDYWSEIWATAPNDLNEYEVGGTEFTEVEVISE